MTAPAPAPSAAGIAGLKESLALAAAAAPKLSNAVAKLGSGKSAQLTALAAQIAAQVALIVTANEALQKAVAPSA